MYCLACLQSTICMYLLYTETRQDEEEVFAESYDDAEAKENSTDPFRINKKFGDTAKKDDNDRNRHMGHPGCPNKWNAYHECNSWCQKHWGDGKKEPESEYLKKYKVGFFPGPCRIIVFYFVVMFMPKYRGLEKVIEAIYLFSHGLEYDEQIRPFAGGMA